MTTNITPYISGSDVETWSDSTVNSVNFASGTGPYDNTQSPTATGTVPASGTSLYPFFDGDNDSLYNSLISQYKALLNNSVSSVVVAQILKQDDTSGVFFSVGSFPYDRPRLDFGVNEDQKVNVVFYTSDGTNEYERVWVGSTPISDGLWHGVGFKHNSIDLDIWVSGVKETIDKTGSTGGSASDWFLQGKEAVGEERMSFIQLGGSCASGNEPINDWFGGINSIKMVVSGVISDSDMSSMTQSLGGAGTQLPEGAIPIDVAFLESSGNVGYEPITLTHMSGYYYLETNITASGTAFIMGNDDQTLDLNGYTITFDNDALPAFPNSSFETDSNGTLIQNISNWEITATDYAGNSITPSGYVNTNDVYFPERSQKVLKIPYSSGDYYTLITDSIGPIASGINYGAYILCGGTAGSFTHSKQFSMSNFVTILDAVSSGVISSGIPTFNAERTSIIHHEFINPSGTNIKIKWEFQNDAGGFAWSEYHLDHAQVRPIQRYGIIASRNHLSDMDSYSGLTEAGQTVYNANRSKIFKTTIKNGIIRQGVGSGIDGGFVDFSGLNNVNIYGIDGYMGGVNDGGFSANNLGTNASTTLESHPMELIMISGCRTFYDTEDVSNRFALYSAIKFSFHGTSSASGCPVKIVDCVASGYPQAGFSVGTAQYPTHPATIHNNTMYPNKRCVNGYALSFGGGNNLIEITSNVVDASGTSWGGRGLFAEGGTAFPLVSGVIADNYVFIKEHKDRESNNGLNARALRLRNNVDSESVHRDLTIRNNTFFCYSPESDDFGNAYGCRISYTDPKSDPSGMINAQIVFRDNYFKTITDSATHNAYSFVIDGCSPTDGDVVAGYPSVWTSGINLNFYDETYESNDVSIKIGDTDGGHNHDCHFWDITLKNSTEGASKDYSPLLLGNPGIIKHLTNTSIMGITLDNTTWDGINFVGSASSFISLDIGPSINAVVTSGVSLYPVPNATITVANASGTDTQTMDVGGSGHYLKAVTQRWEHVIGDPATTIASGILTTADINITATDYADYDDTWTINIGPIVSGITMDST